MKKKRGRPRIAKTPQPAYPILEGVQYVRCKPGMAISVGWVAFDGQQVIGYYKNQELAHKAYQERCIE